MGFNRFSEAHLLKVASSVCLNSPGEIVLIGGGAVLPEITGFQRLRSRSDDLDFIAREAVILPENTSWIKIPEGKGPGLYSYIEGVSIAVFFSQIRGYELPEAAFESALEISTSQGRLYAVRPELNMALKIRRGASRGHIFAKDGLDFAAINSGLELRGEPFDARAFSGYMAAGVCDACRLQSSLECLAELEKGKGNLRRSMVPAYEQTVYDCREQIEQLCKLG
jgi:hypothetical protein